MNDTTIILPAIDTANISAPRKRGRKPGMTPDRRVEQLQQQLEAAKNAAREAERRKYIIVGQAMLAEAEGDAALKSRIVDTLRRRVTSAATRADIASLLAG
jgi:hypothetical protein